MKRIEFLTKEIVGLGGIAMLTTVLGSRCKEDTDVTAEDCAVSPRETKGSFPNKTHAELVRENRIGDRKGIALRNDLTISNKNKDSRPLGNALVDVCHCDSRRGYSEYGGNCMQQEDLTQAHFLRGRQTTASNGKVAFISIYPGYYRGSAPHIHLEIFNVDKKPLLVTQLTFPEDICNVVYVTEYYQGTDYVSNTHDGVFRDSLEHNIADSITGNIRDGYTLFKTVVVDA